MFGQRWKCRKVIADFPIDWYLFHPGSNYIQDRALGKDAHMSRVKLELLLGNNKTKDLVAFYTMLAKLGHGRDLTAFFTP